MWTGFLALMLMAAGSGELRGEVLWNALQPLCGKAYAGRMTEGTEPSDQAFGSQAMIMHVSECTATEIRIPFHVGENRSRTWVLTRGEDFLRLKHDHRHEDGEPDDVTQYGGDAVDGEGLSVDFPADAYTAEMLPAAATNIWTIAIAPGETFAYTLRREEQGRRFKVEFDISNAVPAPPPAW